MSKRIHIVPYQSSWATCCGGASRVSSTHNTQAEAAQAAHGTAIREHGEVIIYRLDGRIWDADSYGNDLFPSKG